MKTISLPNGIFALVDNNQFEKLNKRKWRVLGENHAYVVCYTRTVSGKKYRIMMHRIVIQAKNNQIVDHINGNTLDNRRKNLRICTHRENMWNQKSKKGNASGYKGVTCNQKGVTWKKIWRARINFMGKVIHLGLYETTREAARAYNRAAKKYFGKFARINKLS